MAPSNVRNTLTTQVSNKILVNLPDEAKIDRSFDHSQETFSFPWPNVTYRSGWWFVIRSQYQSCERLIRAWAGGIPGERWVKWTVLRTQADRGGGITAGNKPVGKIWRKACRDEGCGCVWYFYCVLSMRPECNAVPIGKSQKPQQPWLTVAEQKIIIPPTSLAS